MARQSVIK